MDYVHVYLSFIVELSIKIKYYLCYMKVILAFNIKYVFIIFRRIEKLIFSKRSNIYSFYIHILSKPLTTRKNKYIINRINFITNFLNIK